MYPCRLDDLSVDPTQHSNKANARPMAVVTRDAPTDALPETPDTSHVAWH